MNSISTKSLVVICGPTAVGKTAAAISLAQRLGTVIISADSRQLYREMSLGTAKPSATELAAVPHHFIDCLSIHDSYTAGQYERDALVLLEVLFQVHDTVILVGGSGLFIRAICEGFDSFEPVAEVHNPSALATLRASSLAEMQAALAVLDSDYFRQVDTQNPRRLQRALEVIYTTGRKYSEQLNYEPKQRPFAIIKIGLELPRPMLYEHINSRVDMLIAAGLWQEVTDLYRYRELQPLQTVGYQEIFDAIEGRLTAPQAIDKIKQNTRHYAKRQMTWFKKDKEVQWLDAREASIAAMMNLILSSNRSS